MMLRPYQYLTPIEKEERMQGVQCWVKQLEGIAYEDWDILKEVIDKNFQKQFNKSTLKN